MYNHVYIPQFILFFFCFFFFCWKLTKNVCLLLIKATKELYIMKTAMREWEKYTCIKFREKTSSDVNYVRIQNGHGWGFFSWWKKEIDLWHDRDCNSWRIIKVKTLFTFRCNSQLGMVGGEQILNLDINGCRWVK